MARLALVLVLGALLVAPTARAAPAATRTDGVYLVRGEKVGVAHRTVPATTGVARAAMLQLLRGPTAAERAAGLLTTIPSGTKLLGVSVSGGVASVNLSRRFESGGGSLSMMLRIGQVVHTLTQFPTVKQVKFLLDGVAVEAIGGEGIIVSPPIDRTDVEGVAPAILVESPAVGDTVSSPLRVRGTANTFEASLTLRVKNESGGFLVTRDIQATSGTGTRGTFSTTLRFTPPAGSTRVQLVAFERSARDGRPIHRVRIWLPLTSPS
ncbi:MAG: GerMN domain-containing protein [Thermoleophilia bacterium]